MVNVKLNPPGVHKVDALLGVGELFPDFSRGRLLINSVTAEGFARPVFETFGRRKKIFPKYITNVNETKHLWNF